MGTVSVKREIAAPPGDVYATVADPYHLPRWWPGVSRVENVQLVRGGRRSQWTAVLATKEGKGVRADFRCVSAAEGSRYAWEQQLAGTPFERLFNRVRVEVAIEAAGEGSAVRIEAEEKLRGMSRLGSPMMRRATRRRMSQALDGLERAVAGGEA